MTRRFESKIVLVTGATSGIGRATAIAFAREGARVLLAARRSGEGESVRQLIERDGGAAVFVRTDVTRPAEVERMVNMCVSLYGGLDVAVNSAGIEGTFAVPTAEYDPQVWCQVIDVNLTGLFYCLKHEIASMLKGGAGTIVNILSGAGLRAFAIGAGYTASKWGGVGMTQAAALEYAPRRIRINGICPGVVLTDMADRCYVRNGVFDPRVIAAHPAGRVGTVEEVAAAALWLCSSEASFINGAMLPVDGGATLGGQ
jgi:NAD(P)-dependent dehydrogenase (short-subunit alcohol dehydrogenase family)